MADDDVAEVISADLEAVAAESTVLDEETRSR